MKSTASKVIVGLVVLVLVGLAGAWYKLSSALVNGTQQVLTKLAEAKQADGSTMKLTYESLSRTSFPVVGVRITNPMIEMITPANPTAMPPTAPVHVVYKRTGTVDVITDYMAHEYRVVSDGSGEGQVESGEQKIAVTSSNSHVVASAKAKSISGFKQWVSLDWNQPEAVKAAAKELGAVRVEVGPLSVTDTTSKAIIFSQEQAQFNLANRSNETTIDFDLAMLLKGSEITKEYNVILKQVFAMMKMPPMPMDFETMPFAASRAGKQDMDIALSAKLPTDVAMGGMPKGSIHVSKFNFKNNFYTLNAPMDMTLDEANGARNVSVKLDWLLDVTAAGGLEGQRFVDMVAGFAPMAGGADSPIDPAVLKQKITAALPTVSTLGPIELKIDLDATSPVAGTAPQAAGAASAAKDAVTLRNFSFGHKRWGIEMKGDSKNDATAGAVINANLVCKKCDALTGDLVATAQGAQDVVNYTTPGRPALPLTPEWVAQLNATLAEIGTKDAASGDIAFAFTTPKPGEMAINGKPMGEVMPKLMAVFAPIMAAASAPAQPPMPAPAQ